MVQHEPDDRLAEIGVRELRQHASRHLARVKAGETIAVTERGRRVALLAPIAEDAWDAMVASGQIRLPELEWDDVGPPIEQPPGQTASERLAALREHER